MNKFILTFFISILLLPNLSFVGRHKLKIDGVWRIVEVQTVGTNGVTTSIFPTESQAIFIRNYYSFCWTNHSKPIRNWQLHDSVKLSRFNQSVINAGIFDIQDSTLTTKAEFAMHPMFTKGMAEFKCSFIKDTLILKGIKVVSPENIANPVYARGSYFVSKLVKIKNLS